MHPVLYRIGSVTIYTYGVLVAAGVLSGLWLARRRAPAAGLDPERVWNLGVYMTLAALAGAKLWLVAFYWDYYIANPREIFTLSTLQSGGVWYGGLLTAIGVAVLYGRWAKLRFLPLADVYVAPLALGHSLGRLGCFAAGCCWGKPTSVPWAVTFTNTYAAQLVGVPLGVPLHPTQLYEAGAELLILLFLISSERRWRRYPGRTFWLYMLMYAVTRFGIEFFRGDDRGTVGMFSTSQFISLLLAPLAIVMLFYLARASDPDPKAARKAA